MGPGGGGADGSRPRSTSTGRREVADGRPRHAGMGIVLRRSWGHVWRVKERRWQVDVAAPGSEPATGCRDWGRESELDDGIGGRQGSELGGFGGAGVRRRGLGSGRGGFGWWGELVGRTGGRPPCGCGERVAGRSWARVLRNLFHIQVPNTLTIYI